jgi:hypothetical protein
MSWRVAKCLDQLLAEVNASAPNRSKVSDGSIGDEDHQNSNSDHNPWCCGWVVTARDITHDPANGFDSYAYAEWQRQRCRGDILLDGERETRVKYVISNRKICSPTDNWAWRNYTGSNPHDHHVHISVDCTGEGGAMDDVSPWGWGSPQQTEDDDMFCKHGDQGDKVWVLQRQLNETGIGDPIGEDWSYGDATAAKVVAVGIAGAAADGRTYGPGEYAELQRILREKWARDFGGGAVGPAGPPGPQGEPGPPGQDGVGVGATVTITGDVTQVS